MQKIGMRNIKTAISVFICIIILRAFHSTFPFYACIAAVITMQSTVHNSFTTGKNRMIGTIIGAIWGLAFALISPNNVFLSSIGIVFVIYSLNLLNRKNSIIIGCVVFLAIMTNLKEGTPLVYSSNRVIETFLGIFVSVLVNYFIFHPKFLDNLHEDGKILIRNIFILSKDIFNFNGDINLSGLNLQISKLEKALDSYLSEIQSQKAESPHIHKINSVIATSKTAYNHLVILNSLTFTNSPCNCYFNENNRFNINELFHENILIKSYMNNDMNIVFNFHVQKLLETLTILREIYSEKY
ncbi:aromatic acid exporter family protein [Clostridium estertheticum]|uniref:FUSC family protein n=1 Tax=Clostridium estertheticum TaxID=238834 RepID=UPI0013E9880C|nr:aromatic acid exporter family protein [Clostridium estertheticum]MBZ9687272.1 aromatic acid exporter family protein [Clostridium estertheticum]